MEESVNGQADVSFDAPPPTLKGAKLRAGLPATEHEALCMLAAKVIPSCEPLPATPWQIEADVPRPDDAHGQRLWDWSAAANVTSGHLLRLARPGELIECRRCGLGAPQKTIGAFVKTKCGEATLRARSRWEVTKASREVQMDPAAKLAR